MSSFINTQAEPQAFLKGAMLTNRNILANVIQIREWMKKAHRGEETVLSPPLMYHIFIYSEWFVMLGYGAKNRFSYKPTGHISHQRI